MIFLVVQNLLATRLILTILIIFWDKSIMNFRVPVTAILILVRVNSSFRVRLVSYEPRIIKGQQTWSMKGLILTSSNYMIWSYAFSADCPITVKRNWTLLNMQDKTGTIFMKKGKPKTTCTFKVACWMIFQQRKLIPSYCINSQLSHCPVKQMFHSRKLINRITFIHERALRIIHNPGLAQ